MLLEIKNPIAYGPDGASSIEHPISLVRHSFSDG